MNKLQYDHKDLPTSHKIRMPQAFMQYAAGAMVEFSDRTLLTAAPYTWDYGDEGEERIIEDSRFAKALKVEVFVVPARVKYVQFPQWYFCPICRRFQPIDAWQREAEELESGGGNLYRSRRRRPGQSTKPHKAFSPHCSRRECRSRMLIPSRVVVACPRGHIDDFPWVKWVHYRNIGGPQPICCEHPVLKFESGGGGTESGEDIRIICTHCQAIATLRGAFAASAFSQINKEEGSPLFTCTGRLPDFGSSNVCHETPRALVRGASALYFPMLRSSLVISSQLNSLEPDIDDLAYRFEEYQALCSADPEDEDQKFSCILASPIEEYKGLEKLHLSQVELIDQLCIVRVFLGYSRIRPVARRDEEGFVHSRLPQDKTYPAYEAYGEGIFLRFSEEALKKWVELTPRAVERAALVERNRQRSLFADDRHEVVSAKFLLLHTLAHLLIRELSLVSGYNVAEIAERIYCADREANNCEFDMAGILIYVAGGDAEGTLGGLIRQGRVDTLPQIFQRALQRAEYCSNDPLCGESQGQGQDGQNLAACHACSLLPETSCEEFNAFLDRGVVVGTLQEPDIGFFGGKWEHSEQ
ncbi:MAG: DUF1998 domain-containing protein [Selenomonadaceae bacterium]|nr:DUF1998 domain-containing protein [Selenomonadaceae bacterium]